MWTELQGTLKNKASYGVMLSCVTVYIQVKNKVCVFVYIECNVLVGTECKFRRRLSKLRGIQLS